MTLITYFIGTAYTEGLLLLPVLLQRKCICLSQHVTHTEFIIQVRDTCMHSTMLQVEGNDMAMVLHLADSAASHWQFVTLFPASTAEIERIQPGSVYSCVAEIYMGIYVGGTKRGKQRDLPGVCVGIRYRTAASVWRAAVFTSQTSIPSLLKPHLLQFISKADSSASRKKTQCYRNNNKIAATSVTRTDNSIGWVNKKSTVAGLHWR